MNELLEIHRRLLEQRRHAMNLVGPGPLDEHYDDSDQAIGWLEPHGRWADLGSGAGFPGIVFAARYPDVALDLVDSRQKRCVFLEAVLLEATDLLARRAAPVRVVCDRIENLPAGAYEGVMARAVASPEAVLEYGRRLLRPGGTAVLFMQGDAELPSAPGYRLGGRRRYVSAGRERMAATFVRD